MKTKQFIRSLFSRPEKDLRKIMPELKDLKDILNVIDKKSDSLEGIVDFFAVISKWYDNMDDLDRILQKFKKVNYGQYDDIIKQINTLQVHFLKAGRDQYGYNRTKRGENVTDDNVYLGNIYGLFTLPVSRWKKAKNSPKGGWGFPGMENLNSYDVVSWQAKKFMDSHIESIIKAIDSLEKEKI
ncbi:MAG: hypothetical protein KBG30_09345 [Bacteroidales bacterium]|nr:hypothetical protein [Bacteroidales bacterium]